MQEMHIVVYNVKFWDSALVLHSSSNAFVVHIALHFGHSLAHKQFWIPF